LLDGKAFQKILDHVRKTNPWLLVLGRIGVHSDPTETGLGSNTENLLRSCPCDVLLTTKTAVPELDVRAEESIRWTPEAEERMKRVPALVKGIARTGVLRLPVEKGHSVITNPVMDEAMDRFMPKYTKDVTTELAEAVALERAKQQPISLCKGCGVAATEAAPVRCAVCGGSTFDVLTPEMLARIAAVEGGLEEDTTYDGRKLKWSEDARRALWTMKDAYQSRRAKARVEKTARMRRLDVVTLEFAKAVIEEETGVEIGDRHQLPVEDSGPVGLKLIARDEKNVPLTSALNWDEDAVQRILRVPSGFMRDRTQQRIEEVAREREATTVTMELVEEGIAVGRKMM